MADIVMPAMDGYEFARQVRADPTIGATPIVFSTAAYLLDEAHRLAEACGVAHIITKPSEPQEILDTVKAALNTTQILPNLPVPEAFHSEHMRLLTDTLARKVEELEAEIAERERTQAERDRLLKQVQAGRQQLEALSNRLLETQEAERRHIARELHDEIGQLLTGLSLLLEFDPHLPADAIGDKTAEARRLVGKLIDEVHELSLELRPTMLDDLGLLSALLWHFERYTTLTGVRVSFDHQGLGRRRFAANLETTIYRIIQEALTNVARHAQVSEVRVLVQADKASLSVQIEDEGAGFDPQAVLAARASSGLTGMRERAVLLGGELIVESTPGEGTQVTLQLPLGAPLERRQAVRSA